MRSSAAVKGLAIAALSALLTMSLLLAEGNVLRASAATMSNASATATGTIANSGTNAYPITVTATTVSAATSGLSTRNSELVVSLPTNWSFVTAGGGASCPTVTFTGFSLLFCSQNNSSSPKRLQLTMSGISSDPGIPAGTTVTVVFPVGTVNVDSNRTFTIDTNIFNTSTVVDTATAVLAGAGSSTVTFDANGGAGSMATQSAGTATALTSNTFTRTGYTYTGWNTAANGTGTAYANGASYPFTSNATLYAMWTANSGGSGNATSSTSLANTGGNTIPVALTALGLGAAGIGLLVQRRRRAR